MAVFIYTISCLHFSPFTLRRVWSVHCCQGQFAVSKGTIVKAFSLKVSQRANRQAHGILKVCSYRKNLNN